MQSTSLHTSNVELNILLDHIADLWQGERSAHDAGIDHSYYYANVRRMTWNAIKNHFAPMSALVFSDDSFTSWLTLPDMVGRTVTRKRARKIN